MLTTAGNIFSYLWTSLPPSFKQARDSIRNYIKTFEKEVEAIHRQEIRLHNLIQVKSSLGIDSKELTQSPETFETPAARKIDGSLMHTNPAFTGRESELHELHEKFSPMKAREASEMSLPTRNPTCCVLHGLGAVGKTQIALEHTYRYREDYDALLWLPSEQGLQIGKYFAQMAARIEDVDDDFKKSLGNTDNQARCIQAVMNWLQ